ncbi:MAG: uracil-DNA glycosylase [Spirochaetaceae bacterium]|nr:uracil-DNA glycosylase [Spirochaetaceae bacterium]
MTTELTLIADFLELAGDYLDRGYRRERQNTVILEGGPELAGRVELTRSPNLAGDQEFTRGAELARGQELAGDSLERVSSDIAACSACGLAALRNRAVPGEGVQNPLALVIGEGPGADEDREGRPFVGPAGQLLDLMLASIKLFRDKNCFIANVVKCRPPHNRDPLPEESAACASFLARQIALLKPRAILCVGRVAAQVLLKSSEGIGRLRGQFAEYQGIPLLPTYHPSALLRDQSLKRPAWEDLKLLKEKLAGLDPVYAGECRETRP